MTHQGSVSTRGCALVALGFAASLLGPPVPVSAQEKRAATPTLEALAARLQQLEDKEEITNVLVEYGRALDSRDFKGYANLFTRDGSWSGGLGSVSGGPQAIYDFMTSRIGGGRAAAAGANDAGAGSGRQSGGGGFGSTYHIMSSFAIDVTGDAATASSRWAFVSAARGPGIQVAGRYEDTLVREGGVWKIKSRHAFNDVAAPAAGSAAGGASAPASGQR
jgi:ketosteroid isomerase-like protein